jgi:hypothetical protein
MRLLPIPWRAVAYLVGGGLIFYGLGLGPYLFLIFFFRSIFTLFKSPKLMINNHGREIASNQTRKRRTNFLYYSINTYFGKLAGWKKSHNLSWGGW